VSKSVESTVTEGAITVTNHLASWTLSSMFVALMASGLDVPAFGQRPYYATPPPESGPTPMRPYGESGGC